MGGGCSAMGGNATDKGAEEGERRFIAALPCLYLARMRAHRMGVDQAMAVHGLVRLVPDECAFKSDSSCSSEE